MAIWHLKRTGKVKKPEGASWPHRKSKKSWSWSVVFSSVQQQQIISWLDCNLRWKVGFIWQPVMTSSVVGLRRSSEALPKAKLAPKKKKGHGHCLVVCCWSNPLQPSESWQNQYTWEICALKTATPAADIGERKGPILLHNNTWPCHTTNASGVEWSGLQSFASSAIFTWSLVNWPQLLRHLDNFLYGKCFHNQQEAENVCLTPELC